MKLDGLHACSFHFCNENIRQRSHCLFFLLVVLTNITSQILSIRIMRIDHHPHVCPFLYGVTISIFTPYPFYWQAMERTVILCFPLFFSYLDLGSAWAFTEFTEFFSSLISSGGVLTETVFFPNGTTSLKITETLLTD